MISALAGNHSELSILRDRLETRAEDLIHLDFAPSLRNYLGETLYDISDACGAILMRAGYAHPHSAHYSRKEAAA